MRIPVLPPRQEGSHHDTITMHCLDTDAGAAFRSACERLFAVNEWRSLNRSLRTDFRLCDGTGTPIDRATRPGDFIRIDLPGPGSPSGGGYDWVRITAMEEALDGDVPYASLTVEPCPDPRKEGGAVAHFFAPGATNTFVVRRIGNCIQAEVHGRNERPNTKDPALLDRLRNEAVALAGQVGLSHIQWLDWTKGIISVVESEA